MPPVCTLCRHAGRATIDQPLVARQGGSLRDMARRWGVSKDAVARHRPHIPQALAKAVEAKVVAEAGSPLARIEALATRAHTILTAAEHERDWRVCVVAIKTIADLLELIGRVSGELMKADREADREDHGLAHAIREGRERALRRARAPGGHARGSGLRGEGDPRRRRGGPRRRRAGGADRRGGGAARRGARPGAARRAGARPWGGRAVTPSCRPRGRSRPSARRGRRRARRSPAGSPSPPAPRWDTGGRSYFGRVGRRGRGDAGGARTRSRSPRRIRTTRPTRTTGTTPRATHRSIVRLPTPTAAAASAMVR